MPTKATAPRVPTAASHGHTAGKARGATRAAASRLLGRLPEAVLEQGLREGWFHLRTYAQGALIHVEGDACDKLEVILSGRAVIERIDENGGLLRVAIFEPDALLGGNLLFSAQPHYPMTVTAQSALEVLEISRETLFDLLCAHPRFLREYLETVSDHTFLLGNKIRHDLRRGIRESLKNWLRQEALRQRGLTITLPMSKKEMAERIGVQRTSLSRELAKMRGEGLIDFTRTTLTIHDPAFIGGDAKKEHS